MGQSEALKKNKLLEAQQLKVDHKHFSRKQNFSPDNVIGQLCQGGPCYSSCTVIT